MEYVMTVSGPELAGVTRAPLDYDHYLQRQIKPVADAILRLVGRDFDEIIGARRQLALF